MERLDKIVARQLNITRSDSRNMIKSGLVNVNANVTKQFDFKCSDKDIIVVNGNTITNEKYIYIMMNKPKGVISASDGKGDTTVVDILPQELKRKNLFPAGRLDKDTTGFVLITDDGQFAHDILSPRHHVDKTYIATLDKPFDEKVVESFNSGMTIGNDKCLQAKLEPIDNDYTKALVVLKQGLYHQVKRMFKNNGLNVLELERISIGNLPLDTSLNYGECKLLSKNDLKKILQKSTN